MTKREPRHSTAASTPLRRLAEVQLQGRADTKAPEPASPHLVHELQVHQIELEIQNEELRRARDKAGAALASYTDLYDFAPVSYTTLAADGCILQANVATAKLLGFSRERLIGGRFGFFVLESSRRVFNDFLEKVAQRAEKCSCEFDLIVGTGQLLRHTQLTAIASQAPLPPDAAKGPMILLSIQDITDRRHEDNKLKETIALLDQSQREARLGNCTIDLKTGVFTASSVLHELLGIAATHEHTIGTLGKLLHPDDVAGLLRILSTLSSDGMRLDTVVRIARLCDGAVRRIWVKGTLTPDARGDATRFFCTAQDISEHEELREAAAAAQHANDTKDKFLATLSHELRTPLASILLRAGMLQRKSMTDARVKNGG